MKLILVFKDSYVIKIILKLKLRVTRLKIILLYIFLIICELYMILCEWYLYNL